jgi:hypothetical protein
MANERAHPGKHGTNPEPVYKVSRPFDDHDEQCDEGRCADNGCLCDCETCEDSRVSRVSRMNEDALDLSRGR